MKQISGNKLLVKALKEEGVDVLFGYPGACTIDISDELYKQSGIDIILPRHEQALVHEADVCGRNSRTARPRESGKSVANIRFISLKSSVKSNILCF